MAKLDTEWATAEIDAFLQVTDQVSPNTSGSGIVFLGTVMRGPSTDASQRAHVVEQILDRVLPGWSREQPEKDGEYRWLRDQASRAKAALERKAELAEKLGDNAPDMDAANLHPWAWENGRSYWNTGHYHQAVMQAAIRINAETQAKLGRMDISETALFNEAFSPNAPKGGALQDSVWQETTAERRTRTCTVVPAPSPKVSTLRFATPECTCRRKIPEVRSSWPWSSSPHSACWHVGLIKPGSKRSDLARVAGRGAGPAARGEATRP